MQDSLVQAEYWHDPLNEEKYKTKSLFLADINNEETVNVNYRLNLLQLTNLVLVKFEQDSMVEPNDSSWFEFYAPGQAVGIVPLNLSRIYVEVGVWGLKMCRLNVMRNNSMASECKIKETNPLCAKGP